MAMKKSRKLTIIIVLLVIILVALLFFIRVIHIPYTNYQNSLNSAQSIILNKGDIDGEIEVLTKYNTERSYYIVMTDDTVYVYSEGYAKLYEEELDQLEIDATIAAIDQSLYTKVDFEYGYENTKFCLVCKLYTDEQVEYRYYNLETGQLMKNYTFTK